MYVYIPYRNQNDLPVFDTGIPDPNLIELFRPNRFVGTDRVGDENGLTLALTSQTFDTASGTRYLSATIGQAIYFEPARVTLPGQALQSVNTSSLIAEVILTAYHNWNLQFDIASNPNVSAVAQDELTLQYHPSNQQVANLSYRYRAGSCPDRWLGGLAHRQPLGCLRARGLLVSRQPLGDPGGASRFHRRLRRFPVPRLLLEHPCTLATLDQHPHRHPEQRGLLPAGTHGALECRKPGHVFP